MPLQSVSEKTKGDTGRSLFELALLHTLVLKKKKIKISRAKGGGRQSHGSGNTPETKSKGSALLVPRRHGKTSRQAMKSSEQHPRQRPWLPTVIYCKTQSKHTGQQWTDKE